MRAGRPGRRPCRYTMPKADVAVTTSRSSARNRACTSSRSARTAGVVGRGRHRSRTGRRHRFRRPCGSRRRASMGRAAVRTRGRAASCFSSSSTSRNTSSRILGRSKPLAITSGSHSRRCSTISRRTTGEAVAVSRDHSGVARDARWCRRCAGSQAGSHAPNAETQCASSMTTSGSRPGADRRPRRRWTVVRGEEHILGGALTHASRTRSFSSEASSG